MGSQVETSEANCVEKILVYISHSLMTVARQRMIQSSVAVAVAVEMMTRMSFSLYCYMFRQVCCLGGFYSGYDFSLSSSLQILACFANEGAEISSTSTNVETGHGRVGVGW